MNLTPVNSSAVIGIGYQGGTLYLRWKSSGKISEYPGVPQDVYDGLMQSDSKGQFIAANIRKQYKAIG